MNSAAELSIAPVIEPAAGTGGAPPPPAPPPDPDAKPVDVEVAERAIRFAHWLGWTGVHDGEPPGLSPATVAHAARNAAELAGRMPVIAQLVRYAALAEESEGLLALAAEEARLADRHLRPVEGGDDAPAAERPPLRIGGILGRAARWLRTHRPGVGAPDGRGRADGDPGAAQSRG